MCLTEPPGTAHQYVTNGTYIYQNNLKYWSDLKTLEQTKNIQVNIHSLFLLYKG